MCLVAHVGFIRADQCHQAGEALSARALDWQGVGGVRLSQTHSLLSDNVFVTPPTKTTEKKYFPKSNVYFISNIYIGIYLTGGGVNSGSHLSFPFGSFLVMVCS